ncbi:MAG: ABC transporter ATP-binding protein [Proteocatella sp.]
MVVSLKNMYFKYVSEKGNVDVLQNINLNIKEGEFICVLGPSGCGKSTLLKILAGFIKPASGEALMDDEAINGPDYHKGVVFQNPVLYPWLNVEDNIAFGLKMRKFPKNEIAELTKKYLELVGLSGFGKYKPYELSGGMKQRVSLAKTLVNKPRLILMDEPFGALDALTRNNMQKLIRKIWIKTKNTVLLITHDVDEALELATRIIVLSDRPGTIVKEFNTSYTYDIIKNNNENIRYSDEYMYVREEILKIINSQNNFFKVK